MGALETLTVYVTQKSNREGNSSEVKVEKQTR